MVAMPRRVDPDARREQVADAVIDEVAEHGLRSVTLARISARTGLAIGSIRHYFGDTIRQVMRFTLNVLMQRAARRATTPSTDPVTQLVDIITFVVPTDDQEHRENITLVEYRVMARTDAELAADITATSLQAEDVIRSLLRDAMADRTIDEAALDRETLLLLTLIEGFSFRSTLLAGPQREADVRTLVAATVHRVRDAYPPREPAPDDEAPSP